MVTFDARTRPIMIQTLLTEETPMEPRLVRAELDRILRSPGFANSERMSRFLRCVVERAIAGRAAELKEYLIGVEVFDRRADYDPRVDPIVRVEARRLRTKLEEFYDSAAGVPNPEVVIELPKGAYVPKFRRPGASAPDAGVAATRPRSVAVLPIANNSRDSEWDFLCEGITQEVIHALTKATGLRVVAWQSAARFTTAEQDVYSIGRQLGVSYVLRGTLRASGGRMRLLAQLIDTATGEYLWSESYDRQMADVFDVEQEISTAIVRALQTQVGVCRRPTHNPEAYGLYLRGRHQSNKRTIAGLRHAVQHFQAAVALDPEFALGYSGLADALILLADYSGDSSSSVAGCARTAAKRALALDPTLGEAEASLGLITCLHDWDWDSAGAHFRRAIQLNPSYAAAYHWYGLDYLALQGRFEEARQVVRAGVELDPLSPIMREAIGYIELLSRHFTEAELSYRELIDFEPFFYKGWTSLGRALFFQGRYDEALEALLKGLELAGDQPTLVTALAQTYARAGRLEKAEAMRTHLESMAKERFVPKSCFAIVHMGFGEIDEALAQLQEAYAGRELQLAAIGVHPLWDPLRNEPNFQELMRKVGVGQAA
jgi:serine/threonine-protein kinase